MNRDFKKIAVAAVASGLIWISVGCSSPQSGLGGAPVEERSAEFHLPDLKGQVVALSSFQGKVVIVDFWATWCAPCKDAFAFYKTLLAKPEFEDVVVVAVSVDESSEHAAQYVERESLPFVVLWDQHQSVVADFRPPTMPSAYLVNRDGKIVYRHAGFKPSDAAEFEAAVGRLLRP